MHFDCEYNCTYPFINIGMIYTCEHRASQTDYPLTISSVSSHVIPSKKNLDVKGLSIRFQVWERVPRAMRNFFPNLEAIEMIATHLREITWEDFEGLTRLKNLNFKGNKLQTLDGSIFQSMPQLHTISLSKNPLRHINLDTFKHSKELKAIYLRNTSCIDEDAVGSEQIKKFLPLLQARCPPSLEMMQRRQIEQIVKRTHSLEKSMHKVENRLKNLEPAFQKNKMKGKEKVVKKNKKSV